MQQGKMFFFIGLLMAVLQGGVVRRLPLGSEQKVLSLYNVSTLAYFTLFCLSVRNDWPSLGCAQLRHCRISLLSPNAVSSKFTSACFSTTFSCHLAGISA